jgi:2-oxoglutarate/2-oxoacid ferredoxin oxidoreductase subunit alpha
VCINDFVVKFANVNGSGSASANRAVRPSILRMGVPVSPRNIFPSNIQGLPTWYEVRVSGAGLARAARRCRPHGRDEPADLAKDVAEHRARRLPALRFDQAAPALALPRRHPVIGVPLTAICNREFPDRASASCSRTSSISARSRRCSTSSRG